MSEQMTITESQGGEVSCLAEQIAALLMPKIKEAVAGGMIGDSNL